MTTNESYVPVSSVHDSTQQMAVADYNNNFGVLPHHQIYTPGLPTPGLPTPVNSASAPYCQVEFNPVSYGIAPENTLGEFGHPLASAHQSHHLGLNISAVQAFESILPARPHSSPSTFGPGEQDIIWPSGPQRFQEFPPVSDQHVLSNGSLYHTGTYPPGRVPTPRHRYSTSSASASDIKTPQPRRPVPIAPNPAGLLRLSPLKRNSTDTTMEDDTSSDGPIKRRRRSPPPLASPELSDEDRLLLRLKDEEHVSWKDIAARFQSDLGKTYQVPALQMRLKRLRERMRVWTDADVSALRMAHDYWERSKFEIIAAKMVEFGATEKWSPRQCSRKWQEMHVGIDMYAMQSVPTPAFSYTSSPVEGPTPTFAPPPFMGGVPHSSPQAPSFTR